MSKNEARTKETGVVWLPEISESYSVGYVKQYFFVSKDLSTEGEPERVLKLARAGIVEKDVTTNEGQMAASYVGYNKVQIGDLLLNPMDLYSGANCNVSELNGVISPAYSNLRVKKANTVVPKFYDYYFKSQYWLMAMFAHGKGVSFDNRWTLNNDTLRNYEIPVVPYDIQKLVVEQIQAEEKKVDALIANVQSQIEKLKAYKQSIITEVMSKGLDPTAIMKDSEIDWLGKIPETWDVVKVLRIADKTHPYAIGDGDHGLIKPDDYQEEGIPYIRVQNLGWATDLDTSNIVYISEETNNKIKGSTLRPNDVLFAKTGATIGKTAIIPQDMPIANTTSHVGKITVSPKYDPRYIFYVLSSTIGYRQFWEYASTKTTRPELAIDEIKQVYITLPRSKEEQTEIVAYLDKKCNAADKLIAIKEKKVELLQQYKKSLIYEYVTGKKEVV